MRPLVVVTLGFGLALLAAPTSGRAAGACPPELAQAKAALTSAQASVKKSSKVAKAQDVQAPRSQAGARSQEVQAPRGQQEILAPRTQEIQAPRVSQAARLVRETEAACKKGDMALSAQKAREAPDLLKK
jgi:hypothetical protein